MCRPLNVLPALVLTLCASVALAVTEPATVQDTAFSNTNAPRLPVSLLYGHSSTNAANVKYVVVDNASGALRVTGTFYVASNDAWYVYMKMNAPSSTQVVATTTAVDALRVNSASSTQVVATTTAVDNLRINSASSTQVVATTTAVDVLRVNSASSTQVVATTTAVDALRVNSPSSTQMADLVTAAHTSGTELIAANAKLNALPRGGVTSWSTPFVASTTAGAFVVPCPSTSEIVAVGFSIIGSGTQYVYGGINQAGESGMNRIAAINAPVALNNLLMGYSCTVTVDSQVDQGGVLGSVWAIWR